MATQTLYPGGVTWGATRAPGTLVGPPPQWADNSDATYSQANNTSLAQAQLDPLTVAGDYVSAELAIRVAATGTSGTLLADLSQISGGDNYGGSFGDPSTWEVALTLDGVTRWVNAPFQPYTSFVNTTDLFHGGPFIQIYTADAITLTVYELNVTVTTSGGATPQPYRTRQRLYPRSDSRLWPRSASEQASPRRVGGYR